MVGAAGRLSIRTVCSRRSIVTRRTTSPAEVPTRIATGARNASGVVNRTPLLSAVALVSATAAAKADYEQHLHVPADPLMPADDPDLAAERGEHADDQRLHAALIEVKRAVVVRLRDARKIDEIVLRDLQTCLDAEEVGSSAPSPEPD